MNKILDHKSSGEAIKIDNDTAGQLAWDGCDNYRLDGRSLFNGETHHTNWSIWKSQRVISSAGRCICHCSWDSIWEPAFAWQGWWSRFDEEYYSFQVWYTASTARIRWTTHKYVNEMPANGRTSDERYDEYPRAGLNNGNIRMDEFVGEGNGKPDHCILSIRAWSEGTPCLAENNRPCHLLCQDGFHAEG